MAQESASALVVDDFYFSILIDDESESPIFPVSDAKYAEELQLQEALMASAVATQIASSKIIMTEAGSVSIPKPIEIVMLDPETVGFAEEIGEPSRSPCEICAERKESDEMFRNGACTHAVCSECIGRHIDVKIKESKAVSVTCPGLNCEAMLELEACQSVIPGEVVARWNDALCEALILASQKFYCPYRDCSTLLVREGEEAIREAECPICRRLFCAQCWVPWHGELGCEEYQRLNEDEKGRGDLMLRELAKQQSWNRCPHCRFYVEKTEGCLHITCRCHAKYNSDQNSAVKRGWDRRFYLE
ncbi:E3 ubiquitin-protein ligase RSL1 isoform X2 [Malania oleifera]|uniref:E3 ubiquitin-protein ligase RSL1 isoform X2 n=1 Tax=Malania oleifera TaxID=397392 RepID=UPI0025AEC3F1|nr:E3 ubiquitin-protein ligase RSL1 isoform X2 [Malania oleifera]